MNDENTPMIDENILEQIDGLEKQEDNYVPELLESAPSTTEAPESVIEAPVEQVSLKEETEAETKPVDDRPELPKQNVEVHGNWSKPLAGDKIDSTKEQMAMPSDFYDRVQYLINLLEDRESRLTKTVSTGNRQWIEDLVEGFSRTALDNGLIESTTREHAHFTNRPDDSQNGLRPGYPNIPKGATKPQGNEAVRLMSKLMGRGPGMPFTFPLWHTGIWLTVEAPSEMRILELHRLLSASMRDLGNETYGYAFTNYRTFTTERIVDFVLDHLHSSSLAGNIDLRTIISVHDIETLMYGIICAIYPNGFQYTRACSANPETCKVIHEELLNLQHLLVVDKNALTAGQKEHMRKMRRDSMSIDEVRQYQALHTVMRSKSVVLMKNNEDEAVVEVTLRVPNIAEHVSAGTAWITEMSEIISVATEDSLDEDSRRNYMINSSKATIMRQYTHMVDSLRLGDNTYYNKGTGEEGAEDRDTIMKTLSSLSSDDDVMRKFLEEVAKYNSSTALAVTGIPTFTCHLCKGENGSPLQGAFTNLIPIDMFQTFFGLLVQKVQRIRIR